MIANYHTHTCLCDHAKGSMRKYIKAAIKNGIKILGFSEHIPFVTKSGAESHYRLKFKDLDRYFSLLSELKEEYKGKIEIHIGFETEYYPDMFFENLENFRKYKPEYLLLGEHFFEGGEERYVKYPIEDEKILKHNNDVIVEALKTGLFTYLAHPDIFNFVGDEKVYREESLRLCRTAKELGIPLEFNIHGLLCEKNYPCEKFFKIAAEVGNEVIIGLDAHSPKEISDLSGYNEGLEILKNWGVTNIIETVDLVNPF